MRVSNRIISLAEAKKLLKNQKRNRPLRSSWVNEIAEMMDNGLWAINTGDTIKLTSKNELLDGQHRLEAMLVHGKPKRFLVVSGVPPEAQEMMDLNHCRTAADDLAMHGFQSCSILASVAKHLMYHEEDLIRTTGRVGKNLVRYQPREVRKYVMSRPDIVPAVKLSRGASVTSSAIITSAQFATLYCIFGRLSETQRDEFLDKLVNGYGLDIAHPILTLRKLLLKEKTTKNLHFKWSLRYGYFFKTWNLFRMGTRKRVLSIRPSDEWPNPI